MVRNEGVWYRDIGDMEIVKESKNNGTLVMKEVSWEDARTMIIENHYSHTWNNQHHGKINIGIFRDGEFLGVAAFGYPMNPKAKLYREISPFGDGSFVELNRLWISDKLGKNAETILISGAFKIIRACYPQIKYVQSWADGRLGCGTIYKAANFKYFGYRKSYFFENTETGEIYHNTSMENPRRPFMMADKNREYLDGKLKSFTVKTYRYIYPIYNGKQYKITAIPEKPYPDYEKGVEPREHVHSTHCLATLYVIYGEIVNDNEYAEKVLKFAEEHNKSLDELFELVEKFKTTESYRVCLRKAQHTSYKNESYRDKWKRVRHISHKGSSLTKFFNNKEVD